MRERMGERETNRERERERERERQLLGDPLSPSWSVKDNTQRLIRTAYAATTTRVLSLRRAGESGWGEREAQRVQEGGEWGSTREGEGRGSEGKEEERGGRKARGIGGMKESEERGREAGAKRERPWRCGRRGGMHRKRERERTVQRASERERERKRERGRERRGRRDAHENESRHKRLQKVQRLQTAPCPW
jgi:hypothetical protein